MALNIFLYVFIFIFGLLIGSFLNVCIYRIPLKETVVTERSHCMSCGHTLAWYDLFPLFSWLFLRGKCRYCKAPISKQYPIVEGLNAIMWVLCFLIMGFTPIDYFWWTGEGFSLVVTNYGIWLVLTWFLNCLVCSGLIVLSVIDWRTYEIPFKINVYIFVLAVIKVVSRGLIVGDWSACLEYVIGFFAVSVPLLIILLASKGRAMGGGDVKLMAAAGLFLGWKLAIVALLFGCLYGSVIHIIRMKVSGQGSKLAMGPYLAAGIVTAMWFGEKLVTWYSNFF